MTKEEEDVVWSAYLGICVLKTMCARARLDAGARRSSELLVELGTAFPFLGERVGKSALREKKE
jgi:hypothetical protein